MSKEVLNSEVCMTCQNYDRKKGTITGSCRLNGKKMNPYYMRCAMWKELTTGQKVSLIKTLGVKLDI